MWYQNRVPISIGRVALGRLGQPLAGRVARRHGRGPGSCAQASSADLDLYAKPLGGHHVGRYRWRRVQSRKFRADGLQSDAGVACWRGMITNSFVPNTRGIVVCR